MDYLQYRWDLYLWQPDYKDKSFKPYYKWITFNTAKLDTIGICFPIVLNLIINGLPSILFFNEIYINCGKHRVLNLIINGLPSILINMKTLGVFTGIRF